MGLGSAPCIHSWKRTVLHLCPKTLVFKASAEETFTLTIAQVWFLSHFRSAICYSKPDSICLMLMSPSRYSYIFEVKLFMANLSAHEEGTNSTGSFRPRTSHRAWTCSLDFAMAGVNSCRQKMSVLETSKGLHDGPTSRNRTRAVPSPSAPNRTAFLPSFPTNTIHNDKETWQGTVSQPQRAPLSAGCC